MTESPGSLNVVIVLGDHGNAERHRRRLETTRRLLSDSPTAPFVPS